MYNTQGGGGVQWMSCRIYAQWSRVWFPEVSPGPSFLADRLAPYVFDHQPWTKATKRVSVPMLNMHVVKKFLSEC